MFTLSHEDITDLCCNHESMMDIIWYNEFQQLRQPIAGNTPGFGMQCPMPGRLPVLLDPCPEPERKSSPERPPKPARSLQSCVSVEICTEEKHMVDMSWFPNFKSQCISIQYGVAS